MDKGRSWATQLACKTLPSIVTSLKPNPPPIPLNFWNPLGLTSTIGQIAGWGSRQISMRTQLGFFTRNRCLLIFIKQNTTTHRRSTQGVRNRKSLCTAAPSTSTKAKQTLQERQQVRPSRLTQSQFLILKRSQGCMNKPLKQWERRLIWR